ncbi:MAG: hypothetical protein K6F84_08370 [Lachnospiraceae bacterium]|nr:hypothetical protein [Lachnospiraceae bacterium]
MYLTLILKNKKVKGSSAYIATLIGLVILLVVFASILISYGWIMKQNKIERIARQYLLKMEVNGCLTSSDKSSLMNDLRDADLYGVNISGTSLAPVGYGNTVTLHINGTLKLERIWFRNGRFVKHEDSILVDYEKTGTALY